MTAKPFTICNAQGEIVHVGTSETYARQKVPEGGRMVMQEVNPNANWMDPKTGEVKDKKQQSTSSLGRRLNGLPAGATVRVGGVQLKASGSSLDLNALGIGQHDVVIEAPGYLPKTVRVTVLL